MFPGLPISSSSSDLASQSLSNAKMESQRKLEGLMDPNNSETKDEPLRDAFQDFVGQTFFGQLIASMRSTQGETPYFNGGRAEKIFQGQLDQQLAEHMSDASAKKIADPMFELFQLRQK